MPFPNISPDAKDASAYRIDLARRQFLAIWRHAVADLSAEDAETEVVSIASAMRQISELARG